MAVKDSRTVAQRIEVGKTLLAGLETHGPKIVQGQNDFFSPSLTEGETLFDTQQQLDLLKRRVEYHLADLGNLDIRVTDQVHDTDDVRGRIERLRQHVDAKLRALRHTCRGMYGQEHLDRFALFGRFPRGSKSLFRRARLVQHSLNADLDVEPTLDFSTEEGSLTPQRVAAQLEPELTELGEFVDTGYKTQRDDTDVRARRQQAVANFDRGVGAVVQMVKGLLRASGQDDLVTRFRVTFRRIDRQTPSETSTDDATPEPAETSTEVSKPA